MNKYTVCSGLAKGSRLKEGTDQDPVQSWVPRLDVVVLDNQDNIEQQLIQFSRSLLLALIFQLSMPQNRGVDIVTARPPDRG